MIYLLKYELEGVTSSSGIVSEHRAEIVGCAKKMTETALEHLDDYAACADWYDAAGDEAELGELLKSSDDENVLSLCSQVHDLLVSKELGHLSFHEYDDLFELIEDQQVLDWCTPSLKANIRELRSFYGSVISGLSDEWSDE